MALVLYGHIIIGSLNTQLSIGQSDTTKHTYLHSTHKTTLLLHQRSVLKTAPDSIELKNVAHPCNRPESLTRVHICRPTIAHNRIKLQ